MATPEQGLSSTQQNGDLKAILGHTSFLLAHCGSDLRYLFVSNGYAALIGRRPEELVGKSLKEVMGEDIFRSVLPHIEKVLQGHHVQFDNEAHFENAGVRSLRAIYVPEKNSSGEVVGWVVSIVDITDQKRAEKRIAADLHATTRLQELGSELVREGAKLDDCLQQIVDTALIVAGTEKGAVQLLDASGTLTIAASRGLSERFLKFFEYVRNEATASVAALHARKRVIVEDVATSEIFADQPAQAALLEEGIRAVVATPLVSSEGHIRGMLVTHFSDPYVTNEQAQRSIDILVRLAADYLERRDAEDKLRERTEEINTLLDLAPIPICIATDAECKEIRVNRAAAAIYRVTRNTNISQSSPLGSATRISYYREGHRLLPDDLPLQRAAMTGEPWEEKELVLEFGDGERVTISGDAVPLFDARGKVRGVIGTFELTTNAVKYGALSNNAGRVEIRWLRSETHGSRSPFRLIVTSQKRQLSL